MPSYGQLNILPHIPTTPLAGITPSQMADNIRGDGLVRATRALEKLAGHPELLERARSQFNKSSPSYSSPAGSSIQSSDSPYSVGSHDGEDQTTREYRLRQSHPYNQFGLQVQEEYDRIRDIDRRDGPLPIGSCCTAVATKIVRQHWINQGIWRKEWRTHPSSCWKHEEPLQIESDEELNPGSQPDLPFAFGHGGQPNPVPKKKENLDLVKRKTAIREREASRPLQQFTYQILQEARRMRKRSINPDDIHTKAYHIVKQTWCEQMIWNDDWGFMPGRSWAHERLYKHENEDRDVTDIEDEDQVVYEEDDQVVFENGHCNSSMDGSKVVFGARVGHDDDDQGMHEDGNQHKDGDQFVYGDENKVVDADTNRIIPENDNRSKSEDKTSATLYHHDWDEAPNSSQSDNHPSSLALQLSSVKPAYPSGRDEIRSVTPRKRTRRQSEKLLPDVKSSAQKVLVPLNTSKVSKKKSHQQQLARTQLLRRSPRFRKADV